MKKVIPETVKCGSFRCASTERVIFKRKLDIALYTYLVSLGTKRAKKLLKDVNLGSDYVVVLMKMVDAVDQALIDELHVKLNVKCKYNKNE